MSDTEIKNADLMRAILSMRDEIRADTRRVVADLGDQMSAEFGALRQEVSELGSDLSGRIGELHREIRELRRDGWAKSGEITRLKSRVATLERDLDPRRGN